MNSNVFGFIPSSKGSNNLSIGLGYPFLHGSSQLFYSIDESFGVGLGTSIVYDLWYKGNYYLQLRFFKNSILSASIFYEEMKWHAPSGGGLYGVSGGLYTDKKTNGFGFGISTKTPLGLLNTNILITSDSDFRYGLISGIELVQENGLFFGLPFSKPTLYFGWKHSFWPLETVLDFFRKVVGN